MKNKLSAFLRFINIEAFAWIIGISLLAFLPINNESHFTICPIKNLGFDFCPGCGLGKSIHFLLQLNFIDSFNAHPLGIIALPILVFRIITLSKPAGRQIYISLRNIFNNFKDKKLWQTF